MQKAINYPSRFLLCIPSGMAALLCYFLLATPTFAQELEVTLPSGIKTLAAFHAGRASQPALLILHGFLQTHYSPPMNSLASNLASRGYTVLNPTISLGVNKRSQSSACEAAHTYTMEEEVTEIGFWVNWLMQKGYQDIVLIGFSSVGNLGIMIYNAQAPHSAIKKSIMVSLNPLGIDEAEPARTQRIMSSKQHKKNDIRLFTLGYCKKNFAATDRTYLSYAHYDESNTLKLLQETNVPSEIILGTDDGIMPANWLARLEAHDARSPFTVSLIPNANHFFDGTTEFDLAEAVEKSLMPLSSH